MISRDPKAQVDSGPDLSGEGRPDSGPSSSLAESSRGQTSVQDKDDDVLVMSAMELCEALAYEAEQDPRDEPRMAAMGFQLSQMVWSNAPAIDRKRRADRLNSIRASGNA